MKRRNLILSMYAGLMMFSSTSCFDSKDVYNPERVNAEIEASFDFCTTVSCPIEIEAGRKALMRIYAENPETTKNPKQLYVTYTDGNGLYNGTITLPGEYIGKTLYAGADGINIPAKVDGKRLTFNIENNQAATRAMEAPKSETCESLKKQFGDRLPEKQNNTDQLEDKDNINLKVITDNTEVLFTFIFSGASRTAQIYYYYYPTDYHENTGDCAAPGSQNYFFNPSRGYGDYELIINRFKNDKFLLTKDQGDKGYINNGAKNHFSSNILFYGEEGNEGTGRPFPKGYSIGFFIISSWEDVFEPIFTDWWCNSHQDGGIKHSTNQWQHNNKQAARFIDSETQNIIFGFEDIAINETIEDKCDLDYNDFIFLVSANPGFDDTEIPELNEDTTDKIEGTLLYEDLYPSQGDYDMNDVVIEYTYTRHFNSANELTQINYEFTPKHDGAGTEYISEFSLMIDNCINNPIKIFNNHKTSLNQTFTGTITEGIKGKKKDEVDRNAFNPFITVQASGYEVHLSKKSSSPNAKTDELDEFLKHYVSHKTNGGNAEYPFAMDIPMKGFKVVTETVRIDEEYPGYIGWVESKGTENTDWYTKYEK